MDCFTQRIHTTSVNERSHSLMHRPEIIFSIVGNHYLFVSRTLKKTGGLKNDALVAEKESLCCAFLSSVFHRGWLDAERPAQKFPCRCGRESVSDSETAFRSTEGATHRPLWKPAARF